MHDVNVSVEDFELVSDAFTILSMYIASPLIFSVEQSTNVSEEKVIVD